MPYRFESESGELVDLPIRVHPDKDHREVYAHGASGGSLANYHYRIDFYQDVIPPFEYIERGGKVNKASVENGVERKIMVSVYMPLPFVKELRNWLDKNIGEIEQQYGEIQLPKAEEVETKNEQKRKEA